MTHFINMTFINNSFRPVQEIYFHTSRIPHRLMKLLFPISSVANAAYCIGGFLIEQYTPQATFHPIFTGNSQRIQDISY